MTHVNILRIDASSRAEGSFSRALGDRIEARLNPDNRSIVVRRDLAKTPIEHIRNETIAGFYTPVEALTPELMAAVALSDAIISEVQHADIILITTPMYNFAIPSGLKAWFDQLVRIGQTFSYNGTSFEGLLSGKKAYVAVAYGAAGYLGEGPFSTADFVQPYLKFIFNFLGVSDVTFLPIEATTGDEATIAREKAKAERLIDQLVRAPD
jgi:FMN-dependent NADH-azoreductase